MACHARQQSLCRVWFWAWKQVLDAVRIHFVHSVEKNTPLIISFDLFTILFRLVLSLFCIPFQYHTMARCRVKHTHKNPRLNMFDLDNPPGLIISQAKQDKLNDFNFDDEECILLLLHVFFSLLITLQITFLRPYKDFRARRLPSCKAFSIITMSRLRHRQLLRHLLFLRQVKRIVTKVKRIVTTMTRTMLPMNQCLQWHGRAKRRAPWAIWRRNGSANLQKAQGFHRIHSETNKVVGNGKWFLIFSFPFILSLTFDILSFSKQFPRAICCNWRKYVLISKIGQSWTPTFSNTSCIKDAMKPQRSLSTSF